MESGETDYLSTAEGTEPITIPAKRLVSGELEADADGSGTGEVREAESVLLREAGTGQDLLAPQTSSLRSSLYARQKARVRRYKAIIEE
jgi:hypothetical protein